MKSKDLRPIDESRSAAIAPEAFDRWGSGSIDAASTQGGVGDADSQNALTKPYDGILFDILDRMGFGAVLLDAAGKITAMNCVTLRILGSDQNAADSFDGAWCDAIAHQIRAAAFECAREGSWVAVERTNRRPVIIVAAVPADQRSRMLVILVDLDSSNQPNSATLKRLFGLTSAEGKLAAALATGSSPSQLADRFHVTRSTVRSQLASIFTKTHTRRQAELVSLLSRISLLSR